ncbi:MAG TPA: cofactor-independent phosphoglycerate mutase [Thermoleophilia bacterium]|nr:cofactor-independent phosphoglycerate mutase [Thermoleophilia bacterium]
MRKRLLLVPDGMADESLAALGGKTPLEAAATPVMDALARGGVCGLARIVPDGMPPGSDVANLAVLGYDPSACFTGRSPLEAASMGVELGPDDVAYRLNLVTVTDGVMKDNTAGHIPNDEARRCVEALRAELGSGAFEFHVGISYRHLLVWRGGHLVPCTPPHDILDKPVTGHLPGEVAGVAGEGTPAATLTALQEAADAVLEHERPGTSAWCWGEGTAPHIEPFRDHFGLSGAVVGAVDLVRGIGRLAGLDVIDVPGATGGLDTDYGAKGRAALAALEDHDLVWVHVEAPDEAGHMGDLREKIRAIERIDAEILAPILASAGRRPGVLVVPDHLTPLRTRTHASGPVPFVISESLPGAGGGGAMGYGESQAAATGLYVDSGAALMRLFLEATG